MNESTKQVEIPEVVKNRFKDAMAIYNLLLDRRYAEIAARHSAVKFLPGRVEKNALEALIESQGFTRINMDSGIVIQTWEHMYECKQMEYNFVIGEAEKNLDELKQQCTRRVDDAINNVIADISDKYDQYIKLAPELTKQHIRADVSEKLKEELTLLAK